MMNKATLKQVFQACEDMVRNGEKPTFTALNVKFPSARRNTLLDKYHQWKSTKSEQQLAAIYDKPLPDYTNTETALKQLQGQIDRLARRVTELEQK